MGFCKHFKIGYVHVPKTGGSSIHKALPNCIHNERHMTAMELRAAEPELFEEYFMFSTIRNPWERMVSMHFYDRKRNTRPHEVDANMMDFNNWITTIYKTNRYVNLEVHGQPFVQMYCCDQTQWFMEGDTLLVDAAITTCNLNSWWESYWRGRDLHIDLNRENNTNHKHYSNYYNATTRELVTKAFSEDIEMFGFKYGEEE